MILNSSIPGEPPPVHVAYLTGVAFCGSTLMSIVLNTHPDVLSMGDSKRGRRESEKDQE